MAITAITMMITTMVAAPFKVEVPSHSGYYLVWQQARTDEPKIVAFRNWLLAKLSRDRLDQALSEPERPRA